MPAAEARPATTPCSAAGWCCGSRSAAIASATTPSCWRRRPSAQSGDQAVDLGAGVGAAGLALARRVEGLNVTLVEIDPALAALAAGNAERNGLAERVRAVTSRCRVVRRRFRRRGLGTGIGRARADESAVQCRAAAVARSRRAARRTRHGRDAGALAAHGGAAAPTPTASLTLIWRADGLAEVLAALDERFRRDRGAAGPPQAGRGGDPHSGAGDKGKPGAARAAAGLSAHR